VNHMPARPRRPPALTAEDIEAVHALIAEATERRVWQKVGKWVVRAVGAVLLAVIVWGLNHLSIQRNDETRHMHSQEAAKVEAKLREVERATKAMALPETASKGGK
jgi:hypothetical protein